MLNLKKIVGLIAVFAVFTVAGCAEPIDGASVALLTKHCLDAGGKPEYVHKAVRTQFECVGLGE